MFPRSIEVLGAEVKRLVDMKHHGTWLKRKGEVQAYVKEMLAAIRILKGGLEAEGQRERAAFRKRPSLDAQVQEISDALEDLNPKQIRAMWDAMQDNRIVAESFLQHLGQALHGAALREAEMLIAREAMKRSKGGRRAREGKG